MQNKIEIEEMLEKIVFDKDNLTDLKNALGKAKKGELSLSELGKIILELRSRILTELIEFIPFHVRQEYTHNALTSFTEDNGNGSQLEQDLEERNQLLETIGQRINILYEKLQKDLHPSS